MNSKITNSQLSTNEPKKQNQKLSKQVEQEQNHRNGDHMDGYQQWGGVGLENGGVCTGNKKLNWQVQNRQGRLRIVWEMEKPKNLYV